MAIRRDDDDDGLGPELLPRAPRRTVGWWVSLGLTLAMAVAAAWYGWHVWEQRRLIGRVEKLGGEVGVETMGPRWLVERAPGLYRDTVTKVTRVRINGGRIDDALVAELTGRPELTSLELSRCGVTDAHVAALVAALPELRTLTLREAMLTDAAADDLAKPTRLRLLDLTGATLSPEAIEKLKAALPDAIIYSGRAYEQPPDAPR